MAVHDKGSLGVQDASQDSSVFEIAQKITRENHEQGRNIYVGGVSRRIIAQELMDAQRRYQVWLANVRSSSCEREVASLRLMALEDVLGQLGVDLETGR